jgi:hypothetical protein
VLKVWGWGVGSVVLECWRFEVGVPEVLEVLGVRGVGFCCWRCWVLEVWGWGVGGVRCLRCEVLGVGGVGCCKCEVGVLEVLGVGGVRLGFWRCEVGVLEV